MKRLHDYSIPFVGLKNGLHYFNFEVDDTFFANFENSMVERGKVFVDISLDKRTRVMTLVFDIGGAVYTECDRCLEAIDLPIHGHHKLYVKVSSGQTSKDPEYELELGSDEVMLIGEDATHLELAKIMYDFIQLSIPIQRTCDQVPEKGTCNQEMLSKMDGSDQTEEAPIDPRWEKLRNLESPDGVKK